MLIEAGADVNPVKTGSSSLIWQAIHQRDNDSLKLLLELGTDFLIQRNINLTVLASQ